jgi:hypothetical protein
MRLCLLVLLFIAAPLHAQIRPWVELGLGTGRDRTPCPSCRAPAEGGFATARIVIGARVAPHAGVGVGVDHGVPLDIIDGEGGFSVMSTFAELAYPREPALRGRAGIGWAFSGTPDEESGQGMTVRLGGVLQVPRTSAIGLALAVDYFHAVSGHYRRVSSYMPTVPARSPFDFRMLQLSVSLRIGGRYSRRP